MNNNDKALEEMRRKRFSNKDYWVIVLLILVAFLGHMAWDYHIRIGDTESYVKGKAELNAKELAKELVDYTMEELKDFHFQRGYDTGYALRDSECDCTDIENGMSKYLELNVGGVE